MGNDPNSAVILPESLDVGDRLADKLKDQQHKMEEEIGNMTCVMREMGVLNEKNELDFNSQKRALDQFNLPNKWFKNRLLNDMEVCNKMAESLPGLHTATQLPRAGQPVAGEGLHEVLQVLQDENLHVQGCQGDSREELWIP